jgi:fatty-acyl-CoA synthase
LIIRGGENIYPPEVEEFLHHHGDIAEVAVVGLPDAKYGEIVAAWIVPRAGAAPSPQEIRAYCQGQISHYKIPQHIFIVQSLPKTVTGKVRKHVLKENAVSELGLFEAAAIPTA